jgi:hypothetical protein
MMRNRFLPQQYDTLDVTTHLPELGADLVTALAGLNMEDFSHCCCLSIVKTDTIDLCVVGARRVCRLGI